jgi:hypothetical protein
VLKGAEKFAAALGQQGRVVAGQFDIDESNLGVCGGQPVKGGDTAADPVFQPKATEADHGIKETGDLLGSLLDVFDWHDIPV